MFAQYKTQHDTIAVSPITEAYFNLTKAKSFGASSSCAEG